MSGAIEIIFHPSQFPDAVREELACSLRERAINHKFHYDTYKQTQKWLALHEAYSPARTDPDCAAIYAAAFQVAAAGSAIESVHVIGLGCGGGQKDVELLRLLREQGRAARYTPIDVSAPMVLVAALAAEPIAGESLPIVCDLQLATDLPSFLDEQSSPGMTRLFSFFGMIPNFEPEIILPRLSQVVRPDDLLLFSANLAPGPDYHRGVERVQPLYDNELTCDWLMTFLLDLGIERSDGQIRWSIAGEKFLRLEAGFIFRRDRSIALGKTEFRFTTGERLRLFFSYRYTPRLISDLLQSHGLAVAQQWVTKSGEEGVFLCRKV